MTVLSANEPTRISEDGERGLCLCLTRGRRMEFLLGAGALGRGLVHFWSWWLEPRHTWTPWAVPS